MEQKVPLSDLDRNDDFWRHVVIFASTVLLLVLWALLVHSLDSQTLVSGVGVPPTWLFVAFLYAIVSECLFRGLPHWILRYYSVEHDNIKLVYAVAFSTFGFAIGVCIFLHHSSIFTLTTAIGLGFILFLYSLWLHRYSSCDITITVTLCTFAHFAYNCIALFMNLELTTLY